MSLKVVTALKARQKFGTIMNAVSFKNDQYIVERKGIPTVAIIPIKKFKQMDKARQRFFGNMSKISDSFAGEDLEKLDDILAEATQAAKQIEGHSFCQRPDQAEFKSRQTPNPLLSLQSRTADTVFNSKLSFRNLQTHKLNHKLVSPESSLQPKTLSLTL